MRRTYKWDAESKEMVEITGSSTDWVLGGTRYGSETLSEMRAKGLVPPSEFTQTWAKAEQNVRRSREGRPRLPW